MLGAVAWPEVLPALFFLALYPVGLLAVAEGAKRSTRPDRWWNALAGACPRFNPHASLLVHLSLCISPRASLQAGVPLTLAATLYRNKKRGTLFHSDMMHNERRHTALERLTRLHVKAQHLHDM